MANYNKFDKVMDELLTGKNGTTSENFSGAALGDFAEHQDLFWDGLLQYLQNENDKAGGVFGIRQNIFPDNVESVIEYINDNADLIDSFLDDCLNPPYHWNESFQRLLTVYRQYFIDHGEIDSTNITIDDILKANAGNSFNETKPWVIPWNSSDDNEITYEQKKEALIPFYTSHNKLKMDTTPVHTFAFVYFTHVERGGTVYEFSETDLDILTKAADNFKRSIENFSGNSVIIQYDILRYDTEDNPVVMSGPGGEHTDVMFISDIPQETIDDITYHYDNLFVFQGINTKGQMGTTMYAYIANTFGYVSFGILSDNISRTYKGETYNPCEIYGDGYDYPVIPLAAVMMHEWIQVLEGYRLLNINFPNGHGYTDEPDLHHTYNWEHVYDDKKHPYVVETNSTNIHHDLMNFYYAVLRGTLYDETTQEEVGMIPYLWDITPLKIHNEDTYIVPHNYSTVRANDKIKRILNDERFLQFTHKLFDKYIRLLMPEYERTVEIEDLNRNFWVIGQVLTGILSFLFDEDSPINDLFNGMLDELAQLWENLLYLWVAFALISQAIRENDIMVLTIPVNNLYSEPYIKFDDFQRNNTTQLAAIWDRLKYLKDVYNRSTLVIIPEVRQNAYLENYYARVSYPGAIIYNRKVAEGVASLCPASQTNVSNQERVEYIPFNKNSSNRNLVVELGDNLRINGEVYQNNPWGVYESSPRYYFKSDFADDTEGLNGVAYVAAIRTIFDIVTPPEFTNGELTDFGISVSCIDVAKELGGASDAEVYSCEYNLSQNKLVCENEVIKDNAVAVVDESKEIVKGWYRGEVTSWIYRATPQFTIILTKNWKNLGAIPSGFRKDAIINVHGVDSEGFAVYDDTFRFAYPGEDTSESLTLPLSGYSNNGHIIDYTFTEQDMGAGRETTFDNTVININSGNNEATFTNKGEDTETETENLFTSNAYVLKIGNYLPTDGVFTMSTMSDGSQYLFTSMRGNITKSRANVDKYKRTANTKYYRFRWDSYNGKNDGDYTTPIPSGLGNKLCYDKNPTEKSSSYPTINHLNYDGLLAVMNFIKKNPNIKKNPAYFITTVGLTPWQGSGRTGADVYWDSAFVPAIFFYIPSIETLSGDPDISEKENIDIQEYKDAYDALDALTFTTDDTEGELPATLVGTIEEDNVVIGKIVSCNQINMYEGYYNHYGNTQHGIQNFLNASGSCWRQFFVTNDDKENSCYRIDYNGGAQGGGYSKYTAKFVSKFSGFIRYFDVRRYQALQNMGRASLLIDEPRAQDSYADVVIDGNGYRQVGEGKIVRTDNNNNTYSAKTSIAANDSRTGLPQQYDNQGQPEDIYSLISTCVGKTASVFHGNTALSTTSVCQYK